MISCALALVVLVDAALARRVLTVGGDGDVGAGVESTHARNRRDT